MIVRFRCSSEKNCCFYNLRENRRQSHVNCESSVNVMYVRLLLSLVSLAMVLLAVETQVSDWYVWIRVLLV